MSLKNHTKVVHFSDKEMPVGLKVTQRGVVVGEVIKTEHVGNYHRVFMEFWQDVSLPKNRAIKILLASDSATAYLPVAE